MLCCHCLIKRKLVTHSLEDEGDKRGKLEIFLSNIFTLSRLLAQFHARFIIANNSIKSVNNVYE